MSTNIMRYHDRFLPAAAYHVSRRHPASFPAGKAWVAGLVMAWVQKHTAVAAREREAGGGVVGGLPGGGGGGGGGTPGGLGGSVGGVGGGTSVGGGPSLRGA